MKQKILITIVVCVVAITAVYLVFQDRPSGPKEIVIFGEDSSNLKAYKSLKDEFAAKTGIKTTFEGTTFEQSVQKADANFRQGKGDYDIVLQYNFSLAPYVRNGYVARIDDVFSPSVLSNLRVNENMFENALRETSYYYSKPHDPTSSIEQFGFPFAANTMLLVYNKDMFENQTFREKFKEATGKELELPTEWNDYLMVAEFFSKVQPGIKGVCMQGAPDGWLYYELANYLFSMGTGTSSKRYGWEEDHTLSIATSKNEGVLRYYKKLHATSSGNFFTVDAPEQQKIMFEGKTAMAIMWSDYVQPLAENTKNNKAPIFGFAPIPGNVSGLAGGAFYINRKSRNLQSASQFVLYALTPENQTKLIEKGLCSAVKTAYTEDVMERVSYARALRDSLERGIFMFEAGTDAEIISTALTTYVQKFIRGEILAPEALKSIENEINTKKTKNH
jgi:multiple sugar transport system substrate-binding protein